MWISWCWNQLMPDEIPIKFAAPHWTLGIRLNNKKMTQDKAPMGPQDRFSIKLWNSGVYQAQQTSLEQIMNPILYAILCILNLHILQKMKKRRTIHILNQSEHLHWQHLFDVQSCLQQGSISIDGGASQEPLLHPLPLLRLGRSAEHLSQGSHDLVLWRHQQIFMGLSYPNLNGTSSQQWEIYGLFEWEI